ncbi:hypothetical protein [Streptomyces sp. NBC_00285]|uniref:hypothetical protein n=1 Tax=Streptomyces sp. NBC_00285 TaxID=2975700 RepID=UPI003FA68734
MTCTRSLLSHPYPQEGLQALAFCPVTPRLATGDSYGTVRVWDFTTSQRVHELDRPAHIDHGVTELACTADGGLLAASSGVKGSSCGLWPEKPLSYRSCWMRVRAW